MSFHSVRFSDFRDPRFYSTFFSRNRRKLLLILIQLFYLSDIQSDYTLEWQTSHKSSPNSFGIGDASTLRKLLADGWRPLSPGEQDHHGSSAVDWAAGHLG